MSQKGGVGKSTLARAIASFFAGKGKNVKIADMDINQSTTYKWQQRRLQSEIKPDISVECFGSVSQAIKQSKNYDLILFDGAPQSNKSTSEIAKSADLIIIPSGLALDDLLPSVLLANSLKESGVPSKKIAFVLCRTGESKTELSEARDYLKQTPYQLLPGQIPEKTAYRRAQDTGLSVVECRYKAPKIQALSVITSIAKLLS